MQAGSRDYQEISFSRAALKRLYELTLTLTLLLALTSALGLAVVLSERFAEPLGLLAEGTRAVDAGRLHAPPAGDVARRARRADRIVQHDDGAARRRAAVAPRSRGARSRRRAPTSRACSATCRRACWRSTTATGCAPPTRARRVILQQPLADLNGMPLADWGKRLPALAPFAELVGEGFRASRDGKWQKRGRARGGRPRRARCCCAARASPARPMRATSSCSTTSPSSSQAQRDAAWAEVARRLAHEIKNPLTPIQLSAERLQLKLAPQARRRATRRRCARHADDRHAGRGDRRPQRPAPA